MHPIPDERLLAFFCGRADAAERAVVEFHLRACRDCARRASTLADFNQALAWAWDEGAGKPPSFVWTPRRRRWPAAAAAAVLLLAMGWAISQGGRPRSPPPQRATAASRCMTPEPGVEILLCEGGRIAEGGGRLLEGACLLSVTSARFRMDLGGLAGEAADGEVLLRRAPSRGGVAALWLPEALADEEPSPEVAVLSGQATVTLGAQCLPLGAGQGVSRKGPSLIRQTLLPDQMASLRESVMGFHRATGGEDRILDGRRGTVTRLSSSRPAAYQVEVRFRVLERPALLGLAFIVDGKDSLWVPDAPALQDGGWHVLRASVTPGWVTLAADGALLHRIPRVQFKPNTSRDVSGIGLVAWGGRVEASEPLVEAWR
jgi:hypothetical protein